MGGFDYRRSAALTPGLALAVSVVRTYVCVWGRMGSCIRCKCTIRSTPHTLIYTTTQCLLADTALLIVLYLLDTGFSTEAAYQAGVRAFDMRQSVSDVLFLSLLKARTHTWLVVTRLMCVCVCLQPPIQHKRPVMGTYMWASGAPMIQTQPKHPQFTPPPLPTHPHQHTQIYTGLPPLRLLGPCVGQAPRPSHHAGHNSVQHR